MHHIPQFYFCNILRWKMSINSLSLFELLTYLARLSKQIRLCEKAFPITHPSEFFCKSTTNWVDEIEVVPIYHTSSQTLRHVYFAIISDYLDIVKFLHGVTGSSIRNIRTEVIIYVPHFLLLLSLYNEEIWGGTILIVFYPVNGE